MVGWAVLSKQVGFLIVSALLGTKATRTGWKVVTRAHDSRGQRRSRVARVVLREVASSCRRGQGAGQNSTASYAILQHVGPVVVV